MRGNAFLGMDVLGAKLIFESSEALIAMRFVGSFVLTTGVLRELPVELSKAMRIC